MLWTTDDSGAVRRARQAVMVSVLTLLVLVVGVGHARADFAFAPGSDGFSAQILNADGTPDIQAGSAPDAITTSFLFGHTTNYAGRVTPDGNFKDITVHLPPGLVGNTTVVPRCEKHVFYSSGGIPACPNDTAVGIVRAQVAYLTGPQEFLIPLYNLVPQGNEPAAFGFALLSSFFQIHASVRTGGDYGLDVTMRNTSTAIPLIGAKATFWGVPADARHNTLRGACGQYFEHPAGCPTQQTPQSLLRLPSACANSLTMGIDADSWQNRGAFIGRSYTLQDGDGAPLPLTGCEKLPFSPSISVKPDTRVADSPSGLSVDLDMPQNQAVTGLAEADLRDVSVKLPAGMTVSPAEANGLQGCSEDQIGLRDADAERCPDASKIGTVEVVTPLLSDPLQGSVYLAQQGNLSGNGSNPFGSLLALYVTASGSGVRIKLAGKVDADPVTGQLTATFKDNPQLPFSRFHLEFKGGARAPLSTPDRCGGYPTDTTLASWSGRTVDTSSSMTVDQGCAGLGWFGPYFSAGTVNPVAGASSPFVLRVNKPDGQSDLNGIALSLPEGLLGNLKGNIGRQVGTARVAAGVGPNPFWLSGSVVLEGPYKGAPFSLRVTVPAVAGPFNLGDVVVRQRIYVDSHDAHVTVVSDPLPTILQGIPVQLHDLAVDIDKAGFMRNPTSCAPKSIGGTLGAVTGQTSAVASRFQVGDCGNLPLAPKMRMDLVGKKETSRGKHPELSTTLTQQPGESALKKVKVRLPLSLALDPDNAEALCKPEQAAAKACPAASIVGKAVAVSPVLNQPLKGDVFFVEGTRKSKTGRTVKTLPKLWVALRGEVAIDLWADSSISQGKYLVTTFPFVPDAPISSFKLDINGGQHGILAVTGDTGANLCKQANVTQATYDGQNGKQVTDNIRMSSPCGFRVRSKSLTKTHAKVTLSGLGAGKLSISGKGIHKAHRTIKHSDVATITPRLTESGMRTAKRGKALRLRVTWNPKAKGAKTRHARATVKRAAKASSTRAHRRSHRTR